MADLGNEIYQKIKESFDQMYAAAQLSGGSLIDALAKINNGKATFKDADSYAVTVGKLMANAIKGNLKLKELPDENLSLSIAQKTIGESLKDTYGVMLRICETIQEEINEANKIGLKAVQPKLEVTRVDNIVNGSVNAKTQQALNDSLAEAVPTFARQVVDDTQKANARQHDKAGLEVKVEREYDGVGLHNGTDTCDWCLQRAGTWSYEKALDNGVFERHEGCGCVITYTSKKSVRSKSTDKRKKIEDPQKAEAKVLNKSQEHE